MNAPRRVVQRRTPPAANLLAVPAELAAVAERQAGVLARGQLRTFGFSDPQVAAAAVAQRWRTIGRNVVVLSNAPLSDEQRLWVAALLPGKPCALAGPTAAGLTGFESPRIHVLVRHATHIQAPGWIKICESRRFSAADICALRALPVTSTPRSIVDTAAWSNSQRRACAVFCAAVQQRLVRPDDLADALAAAGRVRHAGLLRAILGDIAGGGHTLTEIDLARLARRAGLPKPRQQSARRGPDGRTRYLDAEFDLPDGRVLAVEVDGQGHLDPAVWEADLGKQNEVAIGGRVMLRFASITVRLRPNLVVDQLARMRAAHSDPRRL